MIQGISTYIILFIIYLTGMACIGYYSGKKIATTYDEYLVAGRRMPFFVLVMTYTATGMGAGFTVGTVQKAYNVGIQAALYPTAEAFGSLVLAFLVAKYLNKLGRDMNLYTVAQYLENVYDVRMRVIAAVITALCSSIIVGSQIIGGASVVSAITGISMSWTIWIAGGIVLYYTVNGGLWAVALTDVIQGGLVWIGVAFALIPALKLAGGWDNVKTTLEPSLLSLTSGGAMKFFIVAALASMFNAVTDQCEIQRIFAARNEDTSKSALLARVVIQTPIGWISAILALCAIIIFGNQKFDNPALVLPTLLKTVYSPIIGGIFLVGIMGAVMSTADTLLSAGSSVLIEDIYHRIVNRNASQNDLLRVAKKITFFLGVFSIVLCYYLPGIVDSIILAFSIKGATLAFPIIASIFFKRFITKNGAFWGTLLTAIFVIGWHLIGTPYNLDPVLVGIPFNIISCWIISALTRNKDLRVS
ncbi:MAG: solute:Na+ symporter, family [Thermoanaerobacteraceae bacterium]|nr:solute:Na+ symporter, family [Thermoanaerobacteraceae bacterium]